MAVTNQEIQSWLAANPMADDLTIAAAMNQYGVTPAQMAQATGLNVADVQARYNSALELKSAPPGYSATTPQPTTPPPPTRPTYSTQDIKNWLAANPRATDAQIAQAMNQYGVNPAQMAAATGLSQAAVQQRYNAVSPTGQFYVKPTVTPTTTVTPTLTGTQFTGGMGTSGLAGGTPTSNLPPYSQVNQQQGIAGYAQPYVGGMLGATMGQLFNTDASGNITGLRGYTPYSYNPADYYAAFTPMQQQVFQQAGQMQTPGQFGQATQAANAGILGALSAGGRYGQMATDPYMAAMFMSPYYQNVVNTQMQQAKRQADIAGQAQQAQAARAGAFGGARDLIQRQQANAELQRNLANIQATGTQSAYQDAMKNIQNVANLGLQGAQAGISGAGTLGQLGTSQLGAQTGILGLQSQLGAQQQKQQQDIINQAVQNYQTAQQYPYMQLGFMQNMLQGLPVTTTAQQTYQAPPSTTAQLAGLATTALGFDKLTGGALSSGITDLAKTGWNAVFGAKGGSTQDIKKRGTRKAAPEGLAALALSKM